MAQFIITAAGDSAASTATPTGPFINIVEFRVGSDFATPATALDTGLIGTTLYTGVPSSYISLDANTIGIRLELPAAVGPFAFGEIGLYLAGGVLYARASFGSPQQKFVSSISSVPSVWKITAALKLAQAPALFNITTGSQNQILEVADFSLVSPPSVMVGSPNAVLVHENSPYGQSPILWKTAGNRWSIGKYTYQSDTTLTGISPTTASSPLFSTLSSALPSEYLIEFASGEIRSVTGFSGNIASFTQNLSGPTIGEVVRLHKADAASFSAPRLGAGDYNTLVNLFNQTWSTPTNNGTGNATGWGQTALPTLPSGTPVWSSLVSSVEKAAQMVGMSTDISSSGLVSDWSTDFIQNSTKFSLLTNRVSEIAGKKAGFVQASNVSPTSSGVLSSRGTNWGQIHQDVDVIFANGNEAAQFFNSGGYVSFDLSITPDNMSQFILESIVSKLGLIGIKALDTRSFGALSLVYEEGNGESSSLGNNGFHGLTVSRRKLFSYHIPVGSEPGTSPSAGLISIEVYGTQINSLAFKLELWLTNSLGASYQNAVNSGVTLTSSSVIIGQPSTSLLSTPPIVLPTISINPSTNW